MNIATAQKLSQLTEDFYIRTVPSFSATRSAPWQGWERVVAEANARLSSCVGPVRVLDLACGNLRFERFASKALAPGKRLVADAYDSCDELAEVPGIPRLELAYHHLNVTKALFWGEDLSECLGRGRVHLAVCFGFMHHLALSEHRVQVLKALHDACAPGGVVAVSFWQFSQSERLLKKARRTTSERAPVLGLSDLGPNDYLLGWQDRADVLRYCHDYSNAEIDGLLEQAGLSGKELARFSSDGSANNLNRYVLLEA